MQLRRNQAHRVMGNALRVSESPQARPLVWFSSFLLDQQFSMTLSFHGHRTLGDSHVCLVCTKGHSSSPACDTMTTVGLVTFGGSLFSPFPFLPFPLFSSK